MKNYLIVLDGITAQPQVAEFLAGVRHRTPGVRFYLLVPLLTARATYDSWLKAARFACSALDELRASNLPVVEAVVGELDPEAVWQELARPDRSYDCALRFTPFRRGMHVERLVPGKRPLVTPPGLTA